MRTLWVIVRFRIGPFRFVTNGISTTIVQKAIAVVRLERDLGEFIYMFLYTQSRVRRVLHSLSMYSVETDQRQQSASDNRL